MKDKSSIFILSLGIILLMVGGYFCISGITTEVQNFQKEDQFGSISKGSEQYSTSTEAMEGGSAFGAQSHRILASTTPFGMPRVGDARMTDIVFGSVTITSSTPGKLIIRNATSTTDLGSTTVATLYNNGNDIDEGTYVFDAVLDRGLAIDIANGFFGSYIITWR